MVFRTAALLIKVIIRGRAITPLIVVMIIPSSLATIFYLSAEAIVSQASSAVEAHEIGQAVIVSHTDLGGCASASIVDIVIRRADQSFAAQLSLVSDLKAFIEIAGVRIVRAVKAVDSQQPVISIGVGIASKYNLSPGNSIIMCSAGACISGAISSLHSGPGFTSYIAISNIDSPWVGEKIYICRARSKDIIASIMGSLGMEVREMARFLSIASLAPYAVLSYLALTNIVMSHRGELEVLRGMGAPIGVVRIGFIFSSVAIASVMLLNGIALGTIAVHLSIWMLRFLGMASLARPSPPDALFTEISSVYLLATALASCLAARLLGGRLWSG